MVVGLVVRLIEQEGFSQDTLTMDRTLWERYGRQQDMRRGCNPRKPGRPSRPPLQGWAWPQLRGQPVESARRDTFGHSASDV
ncbi:MAG: hypothetical protein RMN51_10645 [Verrucomicrobiota bacterium]|nr:hypothetical protein [Limisphaera sp.]MDW8382545.1 hypothetical protein [Verrucomicrobiota bacterium]